MKVPESYYDELFDFYGQWDIPSLCGLKIVDKEGKQYVIVTELYQDNSGTSVTAAGKKLAEQICAKKGLSLPQIIYIECTPNTNSVLSFYDENYYEVIFNETTNTHYRKLSKKEIEHILS